MARYMNVKIDDMRRAIESMRFELRERTGDFITGSRMEPEEQTQLAQLILELEREVRAYAALDSRTAR